MKIIFTKTRHKSFAEWIYGLVKFLLLRTNVGHSTLVTEEGTMFGASAIKGKIVVENWAVDEDQHEIQVIHLPNLILTDEQSKDYLGMSYDYFGAAFIRSGKQLDSKMFCHEVVFDVLTKRGITCKGRVKTNPRNIRKTLMGLGYKVTLTTKGSYTRGLL